LILEAVQDKHPNGVDAPEHHPWILTDRLQRAKFMLMLVGYVAGLLDALEELGIGFELA
tara:strand:- start:173 stop:349 length:177 start_codon:yes stop_codon:yes gene_type:complete